MDILSAFRKVTTSIKTWADSKLETKLDKNLGKDNAGKVIAVDASGNISPSNIHTIDNDGNSWFAGNVKVGGAGQDDSNAKQLATLNDIESRVASLVNSAPETLDTLNELAEALGNDPNFATTVAAEIGKKVDKVDGKGLSTNDYTNEEKEKLNNISPSDWDATEGNTQILNKPTKLSQFEGEMTTDEQTTVRTLIGAGMSNFDGDFNSLSNLPFYPSPFNITWDGNTTGLVYTTTTEVPDLGSVLYYQLYNTPPNSNIVEGSKVTMIAGDTPYTLVVMSKNIIDDGNNNYHLLFPTFNELVPLVFCMSTPDTVTVESNGTSFTITFDQSGVYLINSFGSYISEFYKESKKLDEELLPDIVIGKNKCPQLPIGIYENGYVYDYVNYIVLSNTTNAYYDSITSDSFTIPVFMRDNIVASTNGTVSLKIVTEIDTSSLSVSRYVDVSVEIAKLYYGKSYLVLASKQSDGSWKGKVIGNVDIPIDSSPTSGSENLITSGGVYTAINEAIGTALGGSY